MGYGEENENALTQKLAMLTCGSKFGKIACLMLKEVLVEVEHVKAHRTKKDKKYVAF